MRVKIFSVCTKNGVEEAAEEITTKINNWLEEKQLSNFEIATHTQAAGMANTWNYIITATIKYSQK